MIKIEFSISKIAIFLSQSQIALLKITPISHSLVEMFFGKLEILFPQIEILSNFDFKVSNFKVIHQDNELEFLFEVTKHLPASMSNDLDFDEVFFAYCKGIYPVLSLELTQTLINRHIQYLAQYSYSENLPKGIVPYFLSREFVNSLPSKIPSTVHDFLIKNLNNYDTEIFFQEPDLRQYRLDFSISDLRSFKLTEFLIGINPSIEYKDILDTILQNPNGIRSAPSYIEMEIFRGCDAKCTFCPRQFISNEKDGSKLSHEFIKIFLVQLEETFPFPVTICLGGMGEPLLHPELHSILLAILDYPHLEELIIETSLYTGVDKFLETIKSLGEIKKKLSLIVNLTTLKEGKYKEIYKNQLNVKSILDRISSIAELLGKSNIHVQMIKMKEVEEEIEEFFAFFEKMEMNVILQKYNTYAGLMPEKRVSDLSPIKREFCWHTNRDLYINSDGGVSVCKQDLQNQVGNLNTESILEIWKKGLDAFSKSINGKHDKINAPCLTCDEWYTFNA